MILKKTYYAIKKTNDSAKKLTPITTKIPNFKSFFILFLEKRNVLNIGLSSIHNKEGSKNKIMIIDTIVPLPSKKPMDEMANSEDIKPTIKPATTKILPDVNIVGKVLLIAY